MPLWLVGKFVFSPNGWEFQGIFDDLKLAFMACKDANYFIAPVRLNDPVPDDTTEWMGLFYPKAEGD